MKIKIILLLILTTSLRAQTKKVSTSLHSDTAEISIIGVYPDGFPNVSVVFRAETKNGDPLWNLHPEKIRVRENRQPCNIISLCPVSGKKPLNIALVIDHSGSMEFSEELFGLPEGYESPMMKAKKAVKEFIRKQQNPDDRISIIGFSEKPDIVLPLTSDRKKIENLVDGMQATFSTACYDAILAGIRELQKTDGIRVLVVLTDGQDNSSVQSWEYVTRAARKENIPVYTIGLGFAEASVLSAIAKGSKGRYFYSRNPGALDTIYNTISRQIQAYYDLVYWSDNFLAADSNRSIELGLDTAGLVVIGDSAKEGFPVGLIKVLNEKQKIKEYSLAGGIALAAVAGLGIFLTVRRRKKSGFRITRIFPNPGTGKFRIETDLSGNPEGELMIMTQTGSTLEKFAVSGIEHEFDASHLPDGDYLIRFASGNQISDGKILRIRH
jgi:Ca-activated chloride channel family protein